MGPSFPFVVLDEVDSTNNYAMSMLRHQPPEPGTAWFAHNQKAGRGQRGRNWVSKPEMGIHMSVAIIPEAPFRADRFHLSALTALVCHQFLSRLIPEGLSVKWPNDLYWRDRKAGGILIENIISGDQWKWAVVGIGINLNQESFPSELSNAISLKMVTDIHYDAETLARELHQNLMDEWLHPPEPELIIDKLNRVLYKRGEEVDLQINEEIIHGRVAGVDEFGQLHINAENPKCFRVGEVSWI